MRILHTADLHLGRQFNGLPLEEDHGAVLDQIISALISRSVDVLIIAGDIFDRAAPPVSAVRQFNDFLQRVAAESAAGVVMIAGNHDSGDRIAAMSIMADTKRTLIRGVLNADEKPLVLNDAFGPVAFTGLPFAYEYAARDCFGDETLSSPEDVLRAQLSSARQNLPEGARWVVVAHGFVAGASGSEGELPLTRIGGIETVNPSVFEGAHYVALGHLHRPQSAGGAQIRYSGAPLAFGFDEEGCAKSMSLVELDATGQTILETIPFKPLRGVRTLRGKHAELLRADPSQDYIKAILTDQTPVIDAMKRLRDVFPNACELIYERGGPAQRGGPAPEIKSRSAVRSPVDVVGDFLSQVRGEPLSEAERDVVTAAHHRLREAEQAK